MADHRIGGKFTGCHSALDDACGPLDAAAKLGCVSKIVLTGTEGRLRAVGRRMTFKTMQGGWEVCFRSGQLGQTVYVYTDAPEKTKDAMRRAFRKRH